MAGSGVLINPWTGEDMGSVINDDGNGERNKLQSPLLSCELLYRYGLKSWYVVWWNLFLPLLS